MTATGGTVGWHEAKTMGPLERKAYIYAAHAQRGWSIDWKSGRMSPPRR